MVKLVYIIVDGMADLPIRLLNNKTPLEYAYKPNISSFLKHATYGFPSVLGKLAPQSDVGVMADLSYDPIKYSTGRGWFECLGLGMAPKDGELSVRVNFGEVKGRKISSVRTYMSKEELHLLEAEINEKVQMPIGFRFKVGEDYRAGLVLTSDKEQFSEYVSNNEPGYTPKFYKTGKKLSFATDIKDLKIHDIKPLRHGAKYTAELLNLFIKNAIKVIKNSEVFILRAKDNKPLPNYLFLRDAAVRDPHLPAINEKFKRRWAAITGMPLEKGIASAAGMKLIEVEESQDINKNFSEKAESVAAAMRSFDCVYLHIKQTDSVSHLGKYADKYAIIEAIDRIIIGRLLRELNIQRGDTLVMTCDHATSCELKRHINSNIPVLIVNRKFGQNKDFGEANCRKKHISAIERATDILPFVVALK